MLLTLFWTFFRIGLFTFGGGYAMIALIEDACVKKYAWITHEDMMDIMVIAESTPGPIAINCATFVGYKKKGIIGAIITTLAIVLPSFIIIYLIARLLDNFLEITWIAHAFRGIKLAVGILILDAAIGMIRKMKKIPFTLTVMVSSAVIMMIINIWSLHFSSIMLMLIVAIISLFVCMIKEAKSKKAV